MCVHFAFLFYVLFYFLANGPFATSTLFSRKRNIEKWTKKQKKKINAIEFIQFDVMMGSSSSFMDISKRRKQRDRRSGLLYSCAVELLMEKWDRMLVSFYGDAMIFSYFKLIRLILHIYIYFSYSYVVGRHMNWLWHLVWQISSWPGMTITIVRIVRIRFINWFVQFLLFLI